MPTVAVTQEPLPQKAFDGLKEPALLMQAFNRLQAESGVLNGGLTLANSRRVVLADKELVTPSDWTALTLESGFVDAGGDAFFGVRKGLDGTVHLREVFQHASGVPADGTLIAPLPAGFAPAGSAYITGFSDGGAGTVLATVKVVPTATGAQLQYRTGAPQVFQVCSGQWTAVDKSLPAWAEPFRCRLPIEAANPNRITVRSVLIVARAPNVADAGLESVSLVHSPTVERVANEKYPNLVIPRIDGLRELTRYRLTLWAFLE